MVGIWAAYANIYLIVAGVAILAAFGIPLLIVPIHWARALRWQTLHADNLTVFLGRSLGAVLIVLAVFAFKATGSPATQPFFFDLLLWMLALMGLLHMYGAITKTQPITETVEIALWVILFILTLCFYPG